MKKLKFSLAAGCYSGWPGDGICDDACNVAACNFDLGDCFTGGSSGTIFTFIYGCFLS